MDSKYQHQLYEDKISAAWEAAGVFSPQARKPKSKKHFSIVLPPPNANDPLHVGHAMYTVEDVLIRFRRARGEDVLWLPGVDHAGIETQFVFEKKLQKEKKSRFQFDRETLYRLIWDYVQENAGIAKKQLKKLGFSLDWSRFKYTLDDDIVATVLQTFKHLQEEGLVYRDLRLVNYCPKCGTAFSDLEVKHITRKTPLYYLKYGLFVLATTRPETKFGDTAVAIHPDDERYREWLGKTVEVQGVNGPFRVKVIADEYVDREFGTGVVKITPYHDHNDYEVWQRHKEELPTPRQVIDFRGKMTEAAGKFGGLKVAAAREQIVQEMQAKGLIEKIDNDYQTQISACYRCNSTLEPLPRAQFFVRVAPLTAPIIKKLDAGEIKVLGAGYDKILRNWLANLRDWNISRQIVWGIRMPIYYKVSENPQIQVKFIVEGEVIDGEIGRLVKKYPLETIKRGLQSLEAPMGATFIVETDKNADLTDYIQETDTFDTWFSSSQWPFATLQNAKAGDFERFYPTSVMETGYDILPFWVMRMLMVGYFETGKLPFAKIYLHGLVRDQKGQKMSKSKGNVINPLEVVEKYGADALRFALIVRSSPGQDKSIGEGDFRAARNLTNKLWNAARFISQYLGNRVNCNEKVEKEFEERINGIVAKVTENLENYRIGQAADYLYDEFWHYFCDVAIEQCKAGELSPTRLRQGLVVFLKLWQPFLPFVTEQIWQELGKIQTDEKLLAAAVWPSGLAE